MAVIKSTRIQQLFNDIDCINRSICDIDVSDGTLGQTTISHIQKCIVH